MVSVFSKGFEFIPNDSSCRTWKISDVDCISSKYSLYKSKYFWKYKMNFVCNVSWLKGEKKERNWFWFFFVLNATFSYIMATSFSGGGREPPTMGKQLLNFITCGCTLFCNLQSRARTHAILVIGLYELLGNPSTWLVEPPGPSKETLVVNF